jgi:hypothetical protein
MTVGNAAVAGSAARNRTAIEAAACPFTSAPNAWLTTPWNPGLTRPITNIATVDRRTLDRS